eukprot:TRINITY_DN2158_c0_g1_i1.p3 TRINITY_DN2158_c0_g1~~TRINITY_DN2158_c0_g1_i1.p3  ORF type:complete len:131 (-),score=24.35 TRINITY_DN2158_c0_g1_i1:2-394(-)
MTMTVDKTHFGRYFKALVTYNAIHNKHAVKIPCSGVLAPISKHRALLEKLAAGGKERKNDPIILAIPNATNSELALTWYSNKLSRARLFANPRLLTYSTRATMKPCEIMTPHVLCVDTGRSSETAKAHRG